MKMEWNLHYVYRKASTEECTHMVFTIVASSAETEASQTFCGFLVLTAIPNVEHNE